MTDLTEQYRKGELTQDFYYVKCAWCDEIEIRYVQNPECGDVYEEIIAPVPSWESWKKHKDVTAKTQIKNCDLEIINKQLKELLKEIRGKIKTIYDMDEREFITSAAFTDDFVKKIDEVLNA